MASVAVGSRFRRSVITRSRPLRPVGGVRESQVVVPAEAGTHNHRRLRFSQVVQQRLSQQTARSMGPRFRGHDGTHLRVPAAPCARGLRGKFHAPRNQRARGMPDARCTRGPVCQLGQKSCTRAYRAAESIRHSLRNGFTAYIALTPENRALLSPSPREYGRQSPVGMTGLRKA
jgi:hypothetical protein